MALRPLRPCNHPGCSALVRGESWCAKHKAAAEARRAAQLKKAHKAYNRERDESDKFYSTERWRRFRSVYLRRHPLCVECESQGRVTPAVIVDHLKPYKTHPELGLDWGNVRALCRACHNRIGAKVGLIGHGEGGG